MSEIKNYYQFENVVGVDLLGEEYRFDLRDCNNLLLNGSTGSGKTHFIKNLLLEHKNISNEEVQFIIAGLFSQTYKTFLEVNQIKNSKVISVKNDLITNLNDILNLVEERQKILKNTGYKYYKEYNQNSNEKFTSIFFIIDDYLDLEVVYPGDKLKEIIELLELVLIDCADAGINIVISTQKLHKTFINRDILDSIRTRICFRVHSRFESLSVVGTSKGYELSRYEYLLKADWLEEPLLLKSIYNPSNKKITI